MKWSKWAVGALLILVALLPARSDGQSSLSFTFHAGATSVVNGNVMSAANFSTIVVQVEGVGGAFVGTVQFEKKTKDGVNYIAVQCTNAADRTIVATTATVDGYWECPGGAYSFRVPVTARTSGTIKVTGMGTTAVAGRGSGGGTAQGLDANFDINPNINGAIVSKPFRVGDGIDDTCHYTSGTLGQLIKPCEEKNTSTYIWTNFTWCLYDVEGSSCILTVDPDASTTSGIYQFSVPYRPKKTIYIDAGGISVDGTNCTTPTEQALNGAQKSWAFSCSDSNSSIFSGKLRMPREWDGGTVTFTLSVFHGTTETITFAGDFSAQCRGAGDAINGTYGTAIAADVAITTANNVAEATTAAVTPNGTCAGGKFLGWRYVVDAANFSTNAVNSKVLGVAITYVVTSLSS